jgi:hypothetical protein
MNAHSIWLLVGIILSVIGGAVLLAGILSLNAVVGRPSEEDGRILIEKELSGSWRDYWDARREIRDRMGEQWALAPVSRALVYTGGGLVLCAVVAFWLAGFWA